MLVTNTDSLHVWVLRRWDPYRIMVWISWYSNEPVITFSLFLFPSNRTERRTGCLWNRSSRIPHTEQRSCFECKTVFYEGWDGWFHVNTEGLMRKPGGQIIETSRKAARDHQEKCPPLVRDQCSLGS